MNKTTAMIGPTGQPFVIGPDMHPPTKEELQAIIQMVNSRDSNIENKNSLSFGDDILAIFLLSIILISIILILKVFKKKVNKH